MTGSGVLGERILNRLIIKLRNHFKTSPHYKKLWNKNSFDSWDFAIDILKDWSVISDEVKTLFQNLKIFRNDSIHYNSGYDFESNSHNAIKILADIIKLQFDYTKRKDIFWVFDIPGEIWVRSEVLHNPYVIEFILPNCLQLGPYCEPTANPPIRSNRFPLKPCSDEEFLELRKNKDKNSR